MAAGLGPIIDSFDDSFSGLATPARIALLTTLVSLALAGLLWLAAEVLP